LVLRGHNSMYRKLTVNGLCHHGSPLTSRQPGCASLILDLPKYIAPLSCLLQEHAISIAIEPVFLLDGVAVGIENGVHPSKRADQHQEAGLRQVKIGQQGSNHSELVSGVDKDVRFRAFRTDL